MLVVTNGDLQLVAAPTGLDAGLSAQHSLDEGIEALRAALVNATDRTLDQMNGRPLQLRLSGGKDSRLLLGLLRNRNVDLRTVTFGNELNADVRLASRLTELLAIRGEMRSPRLTRGSDIVERVITTLQVSGGVPPSEPHTAQYRGADPERPNEAIMMGHWPLYKGGMATKLGLSEAEINHVLKWQGKNLVKPELRVPFDAYISHWSSRLVVSENLEKLYLFAREFRSGRYLHSHVNQYSGDAMLAYPLVDSEVGAVCDALSMYEKVSEKALFGVLQNLWPEATQVPLDRSRWRFELEGPDPKISGPWYAHRYSAIPELRPMKITEVETSKSEYSHEAIKEMSSYIVRSENFQLFSSILIPRVRQAILRAAKGDVVVPQGMSDALFAKFVWRVCVADLWWSKRWTEAG